MTFDDAEDLLEELEEGGRKSLRMKLLNVERLQTEAMVRAVVERAVESRRRNPERCLFYADLAVDLSKKLRGEGAAAIQARALAERANALRIGERLQEAAEVFEEVDELLLRVEDSATRGCVLGLKGSLLSDVGQVAAARGVVEEAIRELHLAGLPREETVEWVLLSQILTASGELERAQSAVRKAIAHLEADCWDPGLLGHAYGNLVYNLIGIAASTEDPALRADYLGQTVLTIGDIRPFLAQFGTEDDLIQLDWLAGRVMFYDGKLLAAEKRFVGLLQKLLDKGRFLTGAVLGLDLCRVLAKAGQMEVMRQIAIYCAKTFDGAELTADLRESLEFLAQATDTEAVERKIVETMEKCGAQGGAPRWFSL
jgi:tetratricopeptide (TPR) repeat protein